MNTAFNAFKTAFNAFRLLFMPLKPKNAARVMSVRRDREDCFCATDEEGFGDEVFQCSFHVSLSYVPATRMCVCVCVCVCVRVCVCVCVSVCV
jgi:hypothetical protein